MQTICVLSRKAPYATVDASEAIRHAMGGALEDLKVRLVLLDEGVNAARKAQDTSGTDYDNVASAIGDCVDMDIEIHVDADSMENEGIDRAELVDGVKVIDKKGIAGIIEGSDQTMVF